MNAKGAAARADRWEGAKCVCFYTLMLYFVVEQLGVRLLLTEALDPQHCTRGGASSAATAAGAMFLDQLNPVNAHVGFGMLGRHGALGFEGRCVSVLGQRHVHSLGMHPPAYGNAQVAFRLPPRNWTALSAAVAINDDNNFFGTTGGPVVFRVLLGGRELWRSPAGLRHPKHVHRLRVALPSSASARILTLEVDAPGSNACSHAVWLDPLLLPGNASDSRDVPEP